MKRYQIPFILAGVVAIAVIGGKMCILTPVGLILDIVGVILIFWSTKKAESPDLSVAFNYWAFQEKAKWGLGLVLAGFLFQLGGAIL